MHFAGQRSDSAFSVPQNHPSYRLGHDQPEANENGDQRHAEQQSRIHPKPLLIALDFAWRRRRRIAIMFNGLLAPHGSDKR